MEKVDTKDDAGKIETEKLIEEEEQHQNEEQPENPEESKESDDGEFFEIEIDDVNYCTNNDENGFIYILTEDGDIGEKVGYLKDSEPFFYADEK